MSEHIVTELASGVLRIEMRRPEKKNALTGPMYAAMADALERAAREDAVRVVLIHGQPEVFTAGNDLGDFLDGPADDPDRPVFRFLRNIAAAPKPLIAAVTGTPSASAPPCCCTATWCMPAKAPASSCPS